MHEIAGISLDNEMDITLAHRSSMKLAELAGFSIAQQTTFATAVAELLRYTIDIHKDGYIALLLEKKDKDCFIIACLSDAGASEPAKDNEGVIYAQRLINNIEIYTRDGRLFIRIKLKLSASFKPTDADVTLWKEAFNNEKNFSAYDEVKRNNRQLIELAGRLRESEEQYRTMTDALPMMIFTATTTGELLYINKWMSDYTGLTISQFNQKGWKKIILKEELPLLNTMWADKISIADGFFSKEFRVKNNDTDLYLWHRAEGILLHDDAKRTPYWTGFIVDINADRVNKELKETQKMLNEKIEELNRSNKELEEFAYVASHDLQEPLRKIIFYSDFLKKKHLKEAGGEVEGFLNKVSGAALRMKKLISDLLDFSTVTKKQDLFTLIDLNIIFQESLQDLEIVIKEKNAVITADKLPVIEGNHLQMRQLFENLLSNAIKYTAADIVPDVHLSCSSDATETEIIFKDNGIGMESKYSQKVFGLFQRLHTPDEYSGTGLGLAICKKIAESHHGSISINTEVGKGSSFIVRLPLKQ